jgi:hypothetical protein
LNLKNVTQPPWDFLLSASRTTLQSFEQSRLNHAANVRKEIVQMLDAWLAENSNALLARWLIERENQLSNAVNAAATAPPACGGNLPAKPPHSASDKIFGEKPSPASRIRVAS